MCLHACMQGAYLYDALFFFSGIHVYSCLLEALDNKICVGWLMCVCACVCTCMHVCMLEL